VEVEERPVPPQPPAPPPRLAAATAAHGVLDPAAARPRLALRVGDEEVSRRGGLRRVATAGARHGAGVFVERGPDAALGVVEVEGGGVREHAEQAPRHGRLQVLHRHHALHHHHHWFVRVTAAAANGFYLGRGAHRDRSLDAWRGVGLWFSEFVLAYELGESEAERRCWKGK
jgi:hypothetical protein